MYSQQPSSSEPSSQSLPLSHFHVTGIHFLPSRHLNCLSPHSNEADVKGKHVDTVTNKVTNKSVKLRGDEINF